MFLQQPLTSEWRRAEFSERLADQVWEAWDARELNDAAACIAWMLIIKQAWIESNDRFAPESGR